MHTITDALQAHKLELLCKAFGEIAALGTGPLPIINAALERSGYTHNLGKDNTVLLFAEMKINDRATIIVRIEFDCEGHRELGNIYLSVGDDLQLYGEY